MNWREHLQRRGGFLSAGSGGRMVLLGVPLDQTTSFRPGARFAPERIREVSEALEEYSPALDRGLDEISFEDLGDLILPFGDLEESLRRIEEAAADLAGQGRLPLVLGGEHLISLPILRGMIRFYPDLVFLQFDAHADLRDEYLGQTDSHATVVRQIVDLIGGERVYQFGIRSGTREEFAFGRANTRFFPGGVDGLASVLEELAGRPLYLSIDIDVLDPAFAPGTGTPEAGGIGSRELLQALYGLKGLRLVGMDIVEVCPPADPGDITSLLAAKLVREALLLWG
ncbi:MAG: agmatinase [Limnochordia bacterium]|jgi:agmatinase|nr:agmatinase [Bacillota bacterium]